MINESFIENNFKNLVKNNPERQKEIARMGGIKSGEIRRIKSARRKYISAMFDVSYRACPTPEKLLKRLGK